MTAQEVPEGAITSGSPGGLYTVVYDGNCNICRKFVAVLINWDRKGELEILPSQNLALAARYPWIPAKAYLESVQFIENHNGATWQGAAALEHIIDVLPKGRFITWIFSIPFVRPVAEKFYRWFAKRRYHLGCGEHCQLDQPNLDSRGPSAGDQ
ncbi:MAG: DUF393 domain-containing protein [Gemmatimonadales bacterium]